MLHPATRRGIAWLRRRRSLISRRSVKPSRSPPSAWVVLCCISCRPESLQLDQYGIALFPQPLFDKKPCFLELVGQLLGAEEMGECTCNAIAGFVLPIEGGPSSQPHEQPFRRSCRNTVVATREGERNDEDTAGFQNRMRLPQESDPAAPREQITVRDIREQQAVKGFLRVG